MQQQVGLHQKTIQLGTIKRGSFSSVKELIAKIEQFVAALRQNQGPVQLKRHSGFNPGKAPENLLTNYWDNTLGKMLHPEQLTLVVGNGQDCNQQHSPLRVANPPAQEAIRKRLEEANQIRCSGWTLKRRGQEIRT